MDAQGNNVADNIEGQNKTEMMLTVRGHGDPDSVFDIQKS